MDYDVLFMDPSRGDLKSLPTPNDITGSEEVLTDAYGRRLVRVWEHFVVKFGTGVVPIEAENMLFVKKSTTIPIPKVFAIYQSQGDEKRRTPYIVMEYVLGTSLLALWSGLSTDEKAAIATQLRTYFDQLRQLQHPGYFGNIAGGPPLDDVFNAPLGSKEVNGPFATEDELLDCVFRVYLAEAGERMAPKVEYYRRVLPSILRGSGAPVFTHDDFQRKNIIVRPDGKAVMVDWEFAGWYPSYWEYCTALVAFGNWIDDWHKYIAMALDEYPTHGAWMSMMRTEMWC